MIVEIKENCKKFFTVEDFRSGNVKVILKDGYFLDVDKMLEIIRIFLSENKQFSKLYNSLSGIKKHYLHKQIKLKLYVHSDKNMIAFFDSHIMKNTLSYIKGYSLEEVKNEHKNIDKKLYKYEGYPTISKEDEISLLEKLCLSDSYFADEFRDKFEQMKNNILNDLPIMFNIKK